MTPDYIRWLRSRVGTSKILTIATASCIRDEQGRILLQKRSDGADLWGFPGGLMEPGESISQACEREVREETGLRVQAGRVIGVYSSPAYEVTYPNGDQAQPVIVFFECAVTGGELRPDGEETLDLRYFGPDELPTLRRCCLDKARDAFAGSPEVFVR